MNPSPSPAAGRNTYIDTLRGWSIFGVVCIHFAGSFVTKDTFAYSPSFWLGFTLNQVFIFAVPLFIFLSGLLAGMSRSTQPLGEYYGSRLRRIGYPYLVVSVLSFFLLNHYGTWLELPGARERLAWIVQRVVYLGVEPTLYFIPLILMLYIVQPALKALPGWLNRLFPSVSPARFVLIVTALLLVLHVGLGVLCFQNRLDYYQWGRPDPLFWMFYFFAGLHFRTLADFVPASRMKLICGIALLAAVASMAWNFQHHADRTINGELFERNLLDLAYVRPEILVYDLAVVLLLAAGITLGWNARASLVSYVGRFTLEIYLWHILVLYYGAWRYAETLAACRQLPEIIVLICIAATLLIAGATDALMRVREYIRHHRLAVVRVE